MAEQKKSIYVYGDWENLNGPKLIGTLFSQSLKNKEIFSFEYNPAWLKENAISFFGLFLCSCGGLFGLLLCCVCSLLGFLLHSCGCLLSLLLCCVSGLLGLFLCSCGCLFGLFLYSIVFFLLFLYSLLNRIYYIL